MGFSSQRRRLRKTYVAAGPNVSTVSSVSGNEGTSLVHTVTLSAVTTAPANYSYSLGGGTSTSVSDYTVPPTFSNGVTLSGGTLTVPSGVSSFTVSVAALSDGSSESSETYNLTIGGITGVGTISDVGASGVTPSLVVEYVDSSGVRQSTTVVDGVTSINGVAPFLVHFDASGSRSTASTADTEAEAFHYMGYRLNYGEALGTNWSYPAGSSHSRDEDTGPPIFGRVFTATGTKTVQLRCKDSVGNEATISFSVVVSAPPTATNIAVGAGAWPTWANSTHYTLDRGSDYSGFGNIDLSDKHNILISATGSGADPIVGTFRPETSNYSSTIQRSRNIRLQNIDANRFSYNGQGFDYVGIIGGRVRNIDPTAPSAYYFGELVTLGQEANANSCKYARGLFLWDCGEVSADINNDYVFIGVLRAYHAQNVTFRHTGTGAPTFEHNTRGIWDRTTWRNCLFYNDAHQKSWIKGNGLEVYGITNGDQPDTWRSDDRVGDYALGGVYGYPGHMSFFYNVQFGVTGDAAPDQPAGFGPQNNDIDGTYEGLDLCGYENCVAFGSNPVCVLGDNFNFSGRNLFMRNVKYMTGGADLPYSNGFNTNKMPPGWNGPYINENTNTRPVPTAF